MRSLTIETGALSKENARAIAASTWQALEHLELWTGSSSYGAGAKLIADHAERFGHLELLDVSDNYLEDEGTTEMDMLDFNVEFEHQKETYANDPTNRYVSLGE